MEFKTRWEKFKKVILNFIGDTEEDMENTLIIENVTKYEKIALLKHLEEMRNPNDEFELIFKQK